MKGETIKDNSSPIFIVCVNLYTGVNQFGGFLWEEGKQK